MLPEAFVLFRSVGYRRKSLKLVEGTSIASLSVSYCVFFPGTLLVQRSQTASLPMKRLVLYASIIVLTTLAGCAEDDSEPNRNVLIRVENVSTYDYDRVTVDTSGGREAYGSIPSNSTSDYQSFELAYSYATVELTIRGSKFAFTPIDYTGETRLTNGTYTYQVDVDDFTNRSLSVRLR